MKPTIDYCQSNFQMGDLLKSMNVSIRDDFSDFERKKLKNHLEYYMTSGSTEPIKIDLKKFYIRIKGTDEASYLYQYV